MISEAILMIIISFLITIMCMFVLAGINCNWVENYFLLVFLVIFLISCVIFVPIGLSMHDQQITSTYQIYSADMSSIVHGEFCLGSGEVSSQFVYIYYTGDPKSGYKLGYIPADESTIFMDENNSPYIKEIYTEESNGANVDYSYEIHVPSGSIVKQYNMGVDGK